MVREEQPAARGEAVPPSAGQATDCDVLVIGGGPAGCTAAITLAGLGRHVVLLEKDHHPRFHIGESLLPMNLPVFERLGVLERVQALGVRKQAADFPGEDGAYGCFEFARGLRKGTPDHAYQVPRAEFDAMLFQRAVEVGADARQGVRVRRVHNAANAALQVDTDAGCFRPRYVLDCSGRDTFLGNALGLKQRDPRHASAALFSHFTGVARREGAHAGNISIYRHEDGWAWLIPLPNDITSVGVVCFPDMLKRRAGRDHEAFLLEILQRIPELGQRMQQARRVAPVHATGNYAYQCQRMHGPRYSLVGDAYAFVDPMFSSGVFLAMHGAERNALMVDAVLREPAREAALQAALQRELDAGLAEFKWFIYRFTSPAMRWLFTHPNNQLRLVDSVVSMLAGDVYDAPQVRWRLRVFRALYALVSLRMALPSFTAWRRRKRQLRESFAEETLQGEQA